MQLRGASQTGEADVTVCAVPAVISDPERLAAVRATGLLDSPAVEPLDHLARLAASLLQAPLAFVTVVDDERSYWVSRFGVDSEQKQNTVEESFCQYVIDDTAPLIVGDTAADPRTRDNPSVRGMGVRAWAGYPVLDAAGHALGSFCVVDTVPRTWDDGQVEILRVLADAASAHIALVTQALAERDASADVQRLRASEDGLARMATVALELGSVESLDDLSRVIIDHGLPALGADGGAIVVRDDTAGMVRLVVGHGLGPDVQSIYGELPLDSPLPAVHTARTGERLLLPTRAAGVAFTADMATVYEDTRRHGWAFCPMWLGNRLLGSLAASWQDEHDFTVAETGLLEAFTALCAQTLDRLQRFQQQQASTRALTQMSEALQRSLLTQPATPERLSVAFRYEPAAHEAQVGGDWHDAFVTTSGLLTLVIGDVSGHDQMAAASMGQVRNLLRGLAFDSADSPAVLLSRLDAALRGLQLDILATAALARVEQSPADRTRGVRRLRWSSAGHLPPMLRTPDGEVRVLTGPPDVMLGVDPGTDRSERVVELVDGATLLLYTDGLIERRDCTIDDGIDALRDLFATVGGGSPEDVCDEILQGGRGDDHEDDVALLVLRADP